MKNLSGLDFKKLRGKTCLLRVDLNIEKGQEKDSLRIETILPTTKLLLKNKIRVVILSHRGRPSLKNKELRIKNNELSLKPFVKILSNKLKKDVQFIPFSEDFDKISQTIKTSKNQLFLLENLRFWPGEEQNSPEFARKLALLGDFYVNEALAVSHRKNASISAIKRFLPAFLGLYFEEEIKRLNEVMKGYKRPFTIVLGGAKIEEKLKSMKYFWNKADYFLLGSSIDKNKELRIKNKGISKILFPVDVNKRKDIGSQTLKKYSEIIKNSKTIIWNGPMGKFEKKEFAKGTREIWRAILQNKKAKIVVGGGETVASLKLLQTTNYKLQTNIFLSTGGGAMLAYLAGEKLPGIEALK